MQVIDKIFALFSIPVGGALIIFGVLGAFTGFQLHVAGGFFHALMIIVLGWSLCFTLARSWRLSNRYEDLLFKEVMKTDDFASFLERHPEFQEAPVRLQRKQYQMWDYDRRALSDDKEG